MKAKLWVSIAIVTSIGLTITVPAQSSTDNFYKGKTIRFVVGLAPGGGEEVDKYVDKVLAVTPRAKELLDFLITRPKK
jgi:hypothetical protein